MSVSGDPIVEALAAMPAHYYVSSSPGGEPIAGMFPQLYKKKAWFSGTCHTSEQETILAVLDAYLKANIENFQHSDLFSLTTMVYRL